MTNLPISGFEDQHERFEVLVIDDNPGDRLLYRRALGRRMFEVSEAGAGKLRIDACRARRPD
jgi:PleD family two-component response regulator